jgi:GAF domain-containing protein
MAKTDDHLKIGHLIVSTAMKTLKAKAAVIFLMDENEENAISNTAVVQVGLSDRYSHAGPNHAVKISPQLIRDGYMYFRDATTDKRLTNHAAKKAEGIGSILSIPVIDMGKLLGILSVYTRNIRKFSKDEIDFLSILAERGGAEIANVFLVQRLRHQSKIFLNLAASISESLDVKSILQAMTHELVRSLRLKAAAVQLLDEDKRTLKRVAFYGLSEKYMNKGPVLADKNMAEALKGKTIFIKDVLKDTGIQYKKEKKAEGIVSMLYIPIKSKEDIIGVLIVYSGRRREFAEDEIMMMTAIAYQGGLAINNACLYLNMQDDIKDLKENIWSHKSWF